ncbi:MAG: acyl--CoA ligase [Acidobacteria bacterium]|nr:acyl--CoA ligase [Acidobacteriota bacterium]
MGLIHGFLETSATLYPDKTAVVHGPERPTYRVVNRLANQLAHRLRTLGIKPGDRVALVSENGVEYVCGYYGILKAGGVAVPLNTEIKAEGWADILKVLDAAALLVSRKFEPAVRPLGRALPGLGPLVLTPSGLRDPGSSGLPDEDPVPTGGPDSCATIIFTSGSEGKPKGVMLSHANVVANTRSIVEYLALTASDIQMAVLPFFYVMGQSLLNTHVAVGGTVVVNNQFAYTASVLKQMAEEKVTGFSGVPSTYAQLLYKSPLADYRDRLPALRYCSQAGGHMARTVKLALLDALPPQTRLIVMYGATEASARLAYLPPEFLRRKIDSIGRPIPGVTMEVVSADGRVLGPDEPGELVARGGNIMLGYFRDDEATRKVLDHHGYHTGDLGFRDRDGFFFVTGRKDDQVKIDGHRINLLEIEDALLESGQLIECLVFPVPDGARDMALAALAVPQERSPRNADALLEHCRAKLPKYKVPRSLVLVDAIPKTGSGKPDRARASELYLELRGRGQDPNPRGAPHERI